MTKHTQLLIVQILLTIIAIAMIYLGVTMEALPPGLTGAGFLLMVWALQALK